LVAFISPKWRQLLEFNRLLSFADIWKYRADWFEEPNNRRGGWSGVCQLELSDQAGNQLRVFLKRQENHVRRTWRHPLRGEPTFLREFEMLRYLQSCNVAMPAPVFFDSEMVEGKSRAILITEELVGYRPLDTVTEELFAQQRPAIATQRAIVRATASTVRKLHDARIHHRSLYPKHLFVRFQEQGDPDVAIIDLEKSRIKRTPALRTIYDLGTLNRHSKHWSNSSRLYFFKQYLGIEKLNPWTKLLCYLTFKRTHAK